MTAVTPRGAAARRLSPRWTPQRAIKIALALGSIGLGLYFVKSLDFAPGELVSGLFRKDGYLSRALPPTFTSTNSVGLDPRSEWGVTANALVRTLLMAWAGTGFAAILSFPVGLAAARNTTPHRFVASAARALISFCRATPEIVFATVFVLIASIGEKAGVLALAVHSIGMLGKLLADRIEEIDEKPLEAARAAGATRLQVIYNAVLPQVTPSWVNNILYRFDINLRASAVLGFVGAGGIGLLLQSDLKNATRYPLGMATALSLAAVIIIVELFSSRVRNHLKGAEARMSREAREGTTVAPIPGAPVSLTPPWTVQRLGFLGFVWGGIGLWLYCMLSTGLLGIRTLRPFGIPIPLPQAAAIPLKGISQIGKYWPDWNTVGYLYKGELLSGHSAWWHAWRDTIFIAGGAAFLAVTFAIPAAFLIARSTTPGRPVSFFFRTLLVGLRSIPDIALVFFFVSALGTFAFIAKLTADDLDGLGAGAQEALRASGATRGQEVVGAVVPSAVPMIVANAVYCLDVCVRGGVLLGTIAGVGVGYLFTQTGFLPNPFETVGAFVLSTFVIVFGIEQLGAQVRKRLL